MHFVRVLVVQPYNSTGMATAWMNFHFILSEKSDFLMFINQSIEVQALAQCMLTSLSVDEILLPGYVHSSISETCCHLMWKELMLHAVLNKSLKQHPTRQQL